MRIDKARIPNGSYMVRLTSLVSGLVSVGIAATILLAPEVFYASYGIEISGDANLVNELKAPAGALLAAGLLMVAGVFRAELMTVSLTTASVVYLSYGLSRLLSMVMDGVPDSSLVGAAYIELGIGTACVLALRRANAISISTRRSQ